MTAARRPKCKHGITEAQCALCSPPPPKLDEASICPRCKRDLDIDGPYCSLCDDSARHALRKALGRRPTQAERTAWCAARPSVRVVGRGAPPNAYAGEAARSSGKKGAESRWGKGRELAKVEHPAAVQAAPVELAPAPQVVEPPAVGRDPVEVQVVEAPAVACETVVLPVVTLEQPGDVSLLDGDLVAAAERAWEPEDEPSTPARTQGPVARLCPELLASWPHGEAIGYGDAGLMPAAVEQVRQLGLELGVAALAADLRCGRPIPYFTMPLEADAGARDPLAPRKRTLVWDGTATLEADLAP